jgi:hypothetical protein
MKAFLVAYDFTVTQKIIAKKSKIGVCQEVAQNSQRPKYGCSKI